MRMKSATYALVLTVEGKAYAEGDECRESESQGDSELDGGVDRAGFDIVIAIVDAAPVVWSSRGIHSCCRLQS